MWRANSLAEVADVVRAAAGAALEGQTAIGFLSYEAAPAFEPVMRVRAQARMPLAWFALFDDVDAAARPASHAVLPCFADLGSQDAFCAHVERIRSEIAAGRTYQVNLTTRFTGAFEGDAFALYEAVRRAQGSGYHAFIDTGDFQIVSISPELFFETRARRIRTRPMKGTRARGRWAEEDAALAVELAASEKDRAENLMIVDLLRNDLGRIATVGSVEVAKLFDIERYRTVHQMTSTIEAELRPEVQLSEIFGALFPCGSVTGAPKISTMELIAELEPSPREVYCGALGIIEPGGDATFNVPIRTIWIEATTHQAVYGSGAGITFDSDAATEYAEVASKAAVLFESWPAFEMLETMRAEAGRIVRMDRHLARVLASARYFDIPVTEAALRNALRTVAATISDPCVVRLLIDQSGNPRVEKRPLDRIEAPQVALARTAVSSRDRFLFHKTTNRTVYDSALAQRPACWDVLLWNERSEVTEFTRGNVVVELDGKLVTPVRDSGLLAGTFRAELLEAGTVQEGTICIEDLERATKIWLINSVREWVETEGLKDNQWKSVKPV